MTDYNDEYIINLIERVFPGWIVSGHIGSGTFGSVYAAENTDIPSQKCAVKVLIPADDSIDIRDTLLKEAELTSSVGTAANVVRTEDRVYDEKSRCGLIRMELLGRIDFSDGYSEKELLRLGFDICSALEACAKHGIIHRDIKPGNIFSDGSGGYKLGDFGIARISSPFDMTVRAGTYAYIAPEVYHGQDYDFRADIYSLGIVMYRIANKERLPFTSPDKQMLSSDEYNAAIIRRLEGDELPPPADASPVLTEIILRACRHNPADRYSSASEMKKAISKLLFGFENEKPDKNSRMLRAVTGVCAAAALLGVTFGIYGMMRKPETADRTLVSETPYEIDEIIADTGSEEAGEPVRYEADAALFTYYTDEENEFLVITGVKDDKINDLILPDSCDGMPVTGIAGGALRDLAGVREIYIPAGITDIFTDCDWNSALINLPNIQNVIVDENNPVYYSSGNCIIERETGTLVRGYGCSTIPDDGSIKKIGCAAFHKVKINNVVIPDSVKEIGQDAFFDTFMKKLYIPASLEHIHDLSICHTRYLSEIMVSEDNPNLYVKDGCLIDRKQMKLMLAVQGFTIPDDGSVVDLNCYAFVGITGELEVPDCVSRIHDSCFSDSGFTSVRMPAEEKIISRCLFEGSTDLRDVYFPAGITEIRGSAFANCPSLENIWFGGSREQWEAVTIDKKGNEYMFDAKIYVTEGGEYVRYE